MCCRPDGSEQCLPSDLWIWPLGQSQFTTNTGATSRQRELTTSTSPQKPKLGRTRGKHRVHSLADVSGCHCKGSLNTNAKAQGTAQTSELCKYTNSYMQAHTYSLNDTENTCAVSLPCHEVTLWSVKIKMQNQLALVHIKYHMHSY